jgi:hypothetical protein
MLFLFNMSNEITAVISLFIGVSILLGLGMTIMSNSVSDCSAMDDYDSSLADNAQTNGWVSQCFENNSQTQIAFGIMILVTLIIAAAAILFIVRLL